MPSEQSAIERTERPNTIASLTDDLRALGLQPGDVVIVHSSLSALGWVAGGAQAVVEALISAVGPTGTLVMPTQSGQISDPADWSAPPVPQDWVETLRKHLPAYDPYLTDSRGMGQIVDTFRCDRNVVRSAHPLLSFAARGPLADRIIEDHTVGVGLGEGSPLARLYELDASVLLLGVGHANNTSLHLAEYRAEWAGKKLARSGAPMLVDGERQWVWFEDLDLDEDDFAAIGADFAKTGVQREAMVGSAAALLFDQRALVDFATTWMNQHR